MLSKHKTVKATKMEVTKTLPRGCGVYIFANKKETPVYIGKAINLKSRVSSYFSSSTFGKTKEIVKESENIRYIQTNGEFEALILESDLIKKYKPKYNTSLKDDKSPLYIRITNSKYPLVLTARKTDLKSSDVSNFGPFPSSNNVYEILSLLRKIFPFSTHKIDKRPCLYSQINLCSPCPSYIESVKKKAEKTKLQKDYKENIKNIKGVLSGRFTWVKKGLEKKMNKYSKNEDYEMANSIKQKLETFEYITTKRLPSSEFLRNPNFLSDIRNSELAELKSILNGYLSIEKVTRIECYDVSHLSGNYITSSMVTFIDAEPEKKYYRHFKIKINKRNNDVSSLSETLVRRIKHFSDWGTPDLIVVDGGKGQVGAFYKILKNNNVSIPCVGVAKREEKLVIPFECKDGVDKLGISFKEIKLPKGNAKNLLQRVRDESHRFARRYHHNLLKKELMNS